VVMARVVTQKTVELAPRSARQSAVLLEGAARDSSDCGVRRPDGWWAGVLWCRRAMFAGRGHEGVRRQYDGDEGQYLCSTGYQRDRDDAAAGADTGAGRGLVVTGVRVRTAVARCGGGMVVRAIVRTMQRAGMQRRRLGEGRDEPETADGRGEPVPERAAHGGKLYVSRVVGVHQGKSIATVRELTRESLSRCSRHSDC